MKKLEKDIDDTKANGRPDFVEPQLRALEQRKKQLTAKIDELKTKHTPEYEKIWCNNYVREKIGRF